MYGGAKLKAQSCLVVCSSKLPAEMGGTPVGNTVWLVVGNRGMIFNDMLPGGLILNAFKNYVFLSIYVLITMYFVVIKAAVINSYLASFYMWLITMYFAFVMNTYSMLFYVAYHNVFSSVINSYAILCMRFRP